MPGQVKEAAGSQSEVAKPLRIQRLAACDVVQPRLHTSEEAMKPLRVRIEGFAADVQAHRK